MLLLYITQPSESTYIKTNIKAPGLRNKPIQSELDLTYKNRYVFHSISVKTTTVLLDICENHCSITMQLYYI